MSGVDDAVVLFFALAAGIWFISRTAGLIATAGITGLCLAATLTWPFGWDQGSVYSSVRNLAIVARIRGLLELAPRAR